MNKAFAPTPVNKLTALKDTVLVSDMQFEQRQLSSGIILANDNGTTSGIRPRWGQVYAVGPLQKEVEVGQWICVAHGRWTRGVDIEDSQGNQVTIRKIDPNDILLVSEQRPNDDTLSDAVQAHQLSRD